MGLNATQAALLVAAVVAGTRLFHLYGADEVEIDLDFAAVHEFVDGRFCCRSVLLRSAKRDSPAPRRSGGGER